MRIFALVLFFSTSAMAFRPFTHVAWKMSPTELAMKRRDVLTALGGLAAAPMIANADPASTFFYKDEETFEESQMPSKGKLYVNGAFVGDYKDLPGMFPHAAGKIASNGPYAKVSDIYKISGLTDNDKKLFKKYEKELSCNPPGRAFNERINARVST